MEIMSVSLIVTGFVIVVLSLLNWRHPAGSNKCMAVHRSMKDDQIGKQLSKRLPRAEAKLGLYFGLFFVVVGCLRIGIITWMWWGV